MEEQLELLEYDKCGGCIYHYPSHEKDKWKCNRPEAFYYGDIVEREQLACRHFYGRTKWKLYLILVEKVREKLKCLSRVVNFAPEKFTLFGRFIRMKK